MRRCVLVLALAACGHPGARPATVAPAHPAAATTAPAAGKVIDQGIFAIRLADSDAGEEHFTITQGDGYVFDSTWELTTQQGRITTKNQLLTDAAFRPRRATMVGTGNGIAFTQTLSQGPPMTLDIDEGGQKRSLTAPRPVDVYMPDNTIVHLSIFCAGDARAHTVLAFPGVETAVSAAAPTDGGAIVRRTVQASGASAVALYCDGARLIAVEVDAMSMSAVRRGDEARYAAARPKARVKPALPDGLAELERNVTVKAAKGVDGATLACSLVLPAALRDVRKRPAKGAAPAVLLLDDHGGFDRDGDTVGAGGVKLSFVKTLAIELGKAGVVTLRCDDRGAGGSSGDLSKATLEMFVHDAEAAAAALRAEPAVDPKRVGLLGHGEGGTVAAQVAVDLPWLRAVALLGSPGRPLDAVLIDEDVRAMAKLGATDAQKEAERQLDLAVSHALETGAPLPPNAPNAAAIEAKRGWLASEMAHDPIATAAKLKTPAVLIGQADQDQATTLADGQALRDAIVKAGNPGVEYHPYAGLHHWFAPAVSGDLGDLVDAHAVIDARFLADVVGFFAHRL